MLTRNYQTCSREWVNQRYVTLRPGDPGRDVPLARCALAGGTCAERDQRCGCWRQSDQTCNWSNIGPNQKDLQRRFTQYQMNRHAARVSDTLNSNRHEARRITETFDQKLFGLPFHWHFCCKRCLTEAVCVVISGQSRKMMDVP